jgi:hypothetical protein
VTVDAARHAQAHAVARAVNVLTFEGLRAHPQERGRARYVCLRKVDEALLAAALRASRLALKTELLRHCFIMICL